MLTEEEIAVARWRALQTEAASGGGFSPQRLAQLEAAPAAWLKAFYPELYDRPFTQSQLEFFEHVEKVQPNEYFEPVCLCDPRGLGKSTVTEGAGVYLFATARRSYWLITSETDTQAMKHQASVKKMLESPLLLANYPHLKAKVQSVRAALEGWSAERLICESGQQVEFSSLLGKMRGFKSAEGKRPDLWTPDDIDNPSESPEMTTKKREIMRLDFLPALAKNKEGELLGSVIWPQNLIHRNSIMRQVLDYTADMLNDRHFIGPNPLMKFYEAERITLPNGKPKWIITDGQPFDPATSLKYCEQLLNQLGKVGFDRECQQSVDIVDDEKDFREWNEVFHVCTVDEVIEGFKRQGAELPQGRWPERWEVGDGLDWGCLTLDTEILTKDGWKLHSKLERGEMVASYDWQESREIVWTPLLAKVYKEDQPLVEMTRKSFRFVCTPDHAWIVRRKKHKGMKVDTSRRQPLNEIPRTGASLVIAAECRARGEIKCTPAMAAVLGWIVTDGWIQKTSAIICQKNYPEAVIKALDEAGLAWKEIKPNKQNVRLFYICKASLDKIKHATGFKDKMSLAGIATRISPAARTAMLEAMLLAEGTNGGTSRKFIFCQKAGHVSDAFQILASLNGIRLGVQREHESQWGTSKRIPVLRFQHLDYPRITPLEGRHSVWCPSVAEGSVIARYQGQVTITGNTTPKHPSAYIAFTRPDQRYPFDDVYLGIIERCLPEFPAEVGKPHKLVSPGRVARAIKHAWAAIKLVQSPKMSRMSHEASAALNAFLLDLNEKDKVFFAKWKAQRGSGVPSMQNLMEIDYGRPHPFRLYPPGHPQAGQPLMGYTRFILVVAKGQGELYTDQAGIVRVKGAKDHHGFARLRFEIPLYSHKNTESKKINDDACDAARGILADFFLKSRAKTTQEQVEDQMPTAWRAAAISALPYDQQQRVYDAREEDFEAAKAQVLNKRRPATDRSDLWEEGGLGDI